MYLFVGTVNAQLGTIDEPPRLRDLQPMLVEMIYLIWALGGLFFTVLLMWIGFQYMTSAGDPQKKEELKKKGKNWLIGLIIFFLGYPIVSTIYDVIGIGSANPECYEQVDTPGFHFFFPDVCTDAMSGMYETGMSCNDGEYSVDTLISEGFCCLSNARFIVSTSETVAVDTNDDDSPEYCARYSALTNGFCQQADTINVSSCQYDRMIDL